MPLKLRFHGNAVPRHTDLVGPRVLGYRRYCTYVAALNDEAASRVADGVMAAAGNLARFPQIGRSSRLGGRRELVVDQYVLVYRLRCAATRCRLSPSSMPHGEGERNRLLIARSPVGRR